MMIQYIEPGEPNQNACIERFTRTYREEVLDLYLSDTLEQVRQITHRWLIDYNEHRPHDSLGDLTPIEYAKPPEVLVLHRPVDGEAYAEPSKVPSEKSH